MRPWTGTITDEDERRYEAAGFGRPGHIGARPALIIIDVQYRTVGTKRAPYWQAIEEYPTACGEAGWAAVDHIAPLLAIFQKVSKLTFLRWILVTASTSPTSNCLKASSRPSLIVTSRLQRLLPPVHPKQRMKRAKTVKMLQRTKCLRPDNRTTHSQHVWLAAPQSGA